MISNSKRYRPPPAYLDGGQADAGWGLENDNYRGFEGKKGDLEQDAQQACRELLNSRVERASYPTGLRTRSIRLHLKGQRSVIATRRKTPARAKLEVRVLEELGARGALVPKVLAFNGQLLFQEDLGSKRLSTALKRANRAEGERLLDSAITSLAETQATAQAAGLERFVVTLGQREDWRRAFISHSQDLGRFLRSPAPDLPVGKLVERLRVSKPSFIKWDARPPNAIVMEGGKVAWIDWEHCGCRNRLDDLAWLFGDQTVPEWPDVEERLLDRHLPAFLDGMDPQDARDYLAVYGTFHMCIRLGKILNKQNRGGLEDWAGVRSAGEVAANALKDARKTSLRASRWAAKSPLTADLSPWLLEVAELFEPAARKPNGASTRATNGTSAAAALPRGEASDATPGGGLKCLSASTLWGCNVHHEATVIRQEIDLGVLAGLSSGQAGPDFAARFIDRFGGLKTRSPVGGMKADFLDRLNAADGAPFAEVLLQAILAVEDSMAYAMRRLDGVAFSGFIAGSSPDRAILAWSCRNPEISRRAAEVGLTGVGELLPEALQPRSGASKDSFKTAYRSLWKFASQQKHDYNSAIVVQAAERRGIPWEPISGWFLRLGQGKFQHRINNSVTENTSFLAQRFSRDKQITNRLLADVGVPVPRQENPGNIDEALSAAKRIGYPVVVKPLNGNSGKGVCAGLKAPEEIAPAFEHASRFGDGVIVESFVEGQDHRLLIVDGRLVAATKRVPPFVTGDGRRTIGNLVKELNSDPRRDGFTLVRVVLDQELDRLLSKAGYTFETVLAKHEPFFLRSMSNYHAGGTTTDVTDQVHPDNSMMAVRAAAAIGLDVTGVDLVITDISRSHKEVGGAIVEVNARPGFDLHTWPSEGKPRDAAGAVIETMLPPGVQGRVPVALAVGKRGPGSRIAHALDDILRSAGITVGLLSRDGAFVDGEPAGPEEATRRQATQFLLRHPYVEAVVSAVSPLQAKRQGLVHDSCDVAAIIDTGSDDDIEEVRQGLEVAIRATRGKLVVDAESELALSVVCDLDPERLVMVSVNADKAALRQWQAAGGATATIARDYGKQFIVLTDGGGTVLSVPVATVPALADSASSRLLQTHLFAVALAHAMGRTGEEIASALRFDQPGLRSVPGNSGQPR